MSTARDDLALFEYVLGLGDDRLILGHRLSEWCGHAPILEEDIALANIALDCIGQGTLFLELAAKLEGDERTADDLAFFRSPNEYRNLLLVEVPNHDFARTIARQFLFDAFDVLFLDELKKSPLRNLSAIGEKASKEALYHLRHSSQWIVRLGDGTEESHERMIGAFELLWPYCGELFVVSPQTKNLVVKGLVPDPGTLKPRWELYMEQLLREATLQVPDEDLDKHNGGRVGKHTEHLTELLAEMQSLARTYPEADW